MCLFELARLIFVSETGYYNNPNGAPFIGTTIKEEDIDLASDHHTRLPEAKNPSLFIHSISDEEKCFIKVSPVQKSETGFHDGVAADFQTWFKYNI